MNKLYKRAEFLRKFLEYHGLYWEVTMLKEHSDMSLVMYAPMYKGTKINCKPIFKNIDNTEPDLTAITVERDLAFELSHRLLTMFIVYHDSTNHEQAELAKYLSDNVRFKDKYYLSVYVHIDFEYLVQNLILDGVPLDKFPSITDVI